MSAENPKSPDDAPQDAKPSDAKSDAPDTQSQSANDGPRHTLNDLLTIMTALRNPDTGCPWDKEQTFATIAPYTIEEAYEVADAIARNDLFDLRDELGDLLLQVVYHAEIAREQQAFDFNDVAHAVASKMLRRHPHVFGDEDTRAAVNRDGLWDRIKREEKADAVAKRDAFYKRLGKPNPAADQTTGMTAKAKPTHLADIPLTLPALTRAEKLQNKAAKVGFDWPSLEPVFDKLDEEFAELKHAVASNEHDAIEDELGDLLFVIANIARHLKIDPEAALRRTNRKFVDRFGYIETTLAEQGRKLSDSDLAEMDGLWDEAKLNARAAKDTDNKNERAPSKSTRASTITKPASEK